MLFNAHAQRALLKVCFEQEFKTRYRYALVKKKWSEKKKGGTRTNYALGNYVRRRRNGC